MLVKTTTRSAKIANLSRKVKANFCKEIINFSGKKTCEEVTKRKFIVEREKCLKTGKVSW